MKAWSEWEIIHRQVSLAGYIVDKDNNPLANVQVDLTAASSTNRTNKKANEKKATKTGGGDHDQPIDRTISRWDGLYYFLDTPDGQYTLSMYRETEAIEQHRDVSVSRDKNKKLAIWQTDFTLL